MLYVCIFRRSQLFHFVASVLVVASLMMEPAACEEECLEATVDGTIEVKAMTEVVVACVPPAAPAAPAPGEGARAKQRRRAKTRRTTERSQAQQAYAEACEAVDALTEEHRAAAAAGSCRTG